MGARTRAVVVVTLAAIGLVAGCSSGSSSDSSSSTQAPASSAAGSSTPAHALTDYLLRASDVPAGYSEMNVPADQLSGATQSLLSSTKNTKVSPASCQPDLSGASEEAVKNAAAKYFSNSSTGGLIGSVAVPDTEYIAKYRKFNLGSCATHEVSSAMSGQTFTGTVTTKQIDVATPGIDGALVIQQDVTTQVPGTGPVKQSSLLALLPVKGATVSLTQKTIMSTKAPDRSAFATAVAAASKRAANG